MGRRTGSALTTIQSSFCNLTDAKGRVVFTPNLLQLWLSDDFDGLTEWIQLLRADGATHVVVAPLVQYQPSPFPPADLRTNPAEFGAFLQFLLDVCGFAPIVLLSEGDDAHVADPREAFLSVLKPLAEFCLWVPSGWEPAWKSSDTSRAIQRARLILGPTASLWFHSRPERATGASYLGSILISQATPQGAKVKYTFIDPTDGLEKKYLIEDDDPWEGEEIDFWKSHGGEQLAGLLFQTGHGTYVTKGLCDVSSLACWLNRWDEVVSRLGTGYKGWRIVQLCLFETVAMDYYHGKCSSHDARVVASAGRALANNYGVSIGQGNGLPL